MVTHLVQDERMFGFLSVEELMILHPHEHVVVLVCGFHILAVESTSDANFQNEFGVRVIITERDPRVKALHTDVHAEEAMTNFFYQSGYFSQNVDVESTIIAPFLLRYERSS